MLKVRQSVILDTTANDTTPTSSSENPIAGVSENPLVVLLQAFAARPSCKNACFETVEPTAEEGYVMLLGLIPFYLVFWVMLVVQLIANLFTLDEIPRDAIASTAAVDCQIANRFRGVTAVDPAEHKPFTLGFCEPKGGSALLATRR